MDAVENLNITMRPFLCPQPERRFVGGASTFEEPHGTFLHPSRSILDGIGEAPSGLTLLGQPSGRPPPGTKRRR